jgi:hypothetical protein
MNKTISFDSASSDFSKLKEASLLVQTTVQALGDGKRSFTVAYDKTESGTKVTIEIPAPVEAKPASSEAKTTETTASENPGQSTETVSDKPKRSK